MGAVAVLGGIWRSSSSGLPGRREQVVKQEDGGARVDAGSLPQRVFPAGLEGGDQILPHPGRDVGVQAAHPGNVLSLLLGTAEAGPLDDFASARVDLLRGQIAFASGLGSDAPSQLLKAAKRLQPFDPAMARETYLGAWGAALFAGPLAGAGDLVEVSRAALDLPRPVHSHVLDLLLEGLALLITDGRAAAAPVLRQATRTFASADVPALHAISAHDLDA